MKRDRIEKLSHYSPNENLATSLVHQAPVSGERALCLAVLAQAFADLTDRAAEVREKAARYIFDDSSCGPFSFRNIAEAFDFDVSFLRKGAQEIMLKTQKPSTPVSRRARN